MSVLEGLLGLCNKHADRVGVSDYLSGGERPPSSQSDSLSQQSLGQGVLLADTTADGASVIGAYAFPPKTTPRSASQQLAWQRLWSLLLAPIEPTDIDSPSDGGAE